MYYFSTPFPKALAFNFVPPILLLVLLVYLTLNSPGVLDYRIKTWIPFTFSYLNFSKMYFNNVICPFISKEFAIYNKSTSFMIS